jgi:hypothetical protein
MNSLHHSNMNTSFTSANKDPLVAAANAVLLSEDVSKIKKLVSKLKVGDKTNLGVVKEIGSDSITFKAKDTGTIRIKFDQRKTGSKEYVLDKLAKLKEEIEFDIEEAADNRTVTVKTGATIQPVQYKNDGLRLLKPFLVHTLQKGGTFKMVGSLADNKDFIVFNDGGKLFAVSKKNTTAINEEELSETIMSKAIITAQKNGMSDEMIDKFVQGAVKKGVTHKEINAMLLSGKTKLTEAALHPMTKKHFTAIEGALEILDVRFKKTHPFARDIIANLGKGYEKDFDNAVKLLIQLWDLIDSIKMDAYNTRDESLENDESNADVLEEGAIMKKILATSKKIEAYGVMGMQSTPWRKIFSSMDAFEKWITKNDAEVHGIRSDIVY